MQVPHEIERFYALCGGVTIGSFEEGYFSWKIVSPSDFTSAIPTVLGTSYESEKSFWEHHWAHCFYRFAENQAGDCRVLVSCGERCHGIYFDGHQETFGCSDMEVIAQTLPGLLLGLAAAPPARAPVTADLLA
jgi:hypothetical protein